MVQIVYEWCYVFRPGYCRSVIVLVLTTSVDSCLLYVGQRLVCIVF